MYNSNKVKHIDLPENLFSNLGELKSKQLAAEKNLKEKEESPMIDKFLPDTSIKMTNYSNHKEYRNRIDKMYEEIKGIVPIDNEVDGTLFFHNYVEKGIVVKPKIAALKQFWTEYRLISNEKNKNRDKPSKQEAKDNIELNDFDVLFEALSERVDEINQYIDELKEMRLNIDKSSQKLEQDKEKLASEREQFDTYKQKEEKKLAKDKENLKINFDRLQTIIDDLDKKLVSIDQ